MSSSSIIDKCSAINRELEKEYKMPKILTAEDTADLRRRERGKYGRVVLDCFNLIEAMSDEEKENFTLDITDDVNGASDSSVYIGIRNAIEGNKAHREVMRYLKQTRGEGEEAVTVHTIVNK